MRLYSSFLLVCLTSLRYSPANSFVVTNDRNGWLRSTIKATNGDDEQPPDVFDPLLSPHTYPNGTPDAVGKAQGQPSAPAPKEEYEDPFRIKNTAAPKFEIEERKSTTVSPDVFDPLVSPHEYPNGTPDTVGVASESSYSVAKVSQVGILLMDHGSRNQASNDRLHEIARQYQKTVGSHVIVKAAHMEIASPDIPEGLAALLEAGVDEIICHPYFLSPYGRHVAEDIPEIVNGAIESLNIKIPIVTTDPVGAHTEVMIGAIQNVVSRSSKYM
eukprot:CAMPEP_0195287364 /NCGR_PEP_ID=MMETSP0707-20130614/4456_1 /TAXON_ID=33640 /ORGANISM="Asterionellopsis glacialis, Strain CCMP134" /LENGTH=271 /DNA_ID=CAMNT_0040347113 /DNA_START=1 /DNA_END=816 /DNA_ORIENTATION=+